MEKINFNDKDFEYYDYIVEHKKNVMKAFNILYDIEMFSNLQGTTYVDIGLNGWQILRQNILIHDLSKFSKLEFNDYRKCFYPRNCIEKETGDFDNAWKHHYTENSHHPEYWNKTGNNMTKIAMLEMICDWTAMSIKFKSCPLDHYRSKKLKLKEEFGNKLDHDFLNAVLNKVITRLDKGTVIKVVS